MIEEDAGKVTTLYFSAYISNQVRNKTFCKNAVRLIRCNAVLLVCWNSLVYFFQWNKHEKNVFAHRKLSEFMKSKGKQFKRSPMLCNILNAFSFASFRWFIYVNWCLLFYFIFYTMWILSPYIALIWCWVCENTSLLQIFQYKCYNIVMLAQWAPVEPSIGIYE